MNRTRAVYLVARRELVERARSRAFLIGLVITEALILAGFLLPSLFGGGGDDGLTVGYVGQPPSDVRTAITLAGTAFDTEVSIEPLADVSAAEAAVREARVEAAIVPPDAGSGGGTAGELLVRDRPDPRVQAVVQAAYVILADIQAPPVPTVRSLEPQAEVDEIAFLLANAGVVLLFISIFSFGYWVLTGVVEEKQSRVVEVVLSTVVPRDLLMGKVLGIGILGLVQLVAMVVTALVLAQVTGRFELPPTTGPAVAMVFVWFGIGYALYATMFAVLGALASRMEEASNATTPVSLLATAGYLLGLLVVPGDPTGVVARLATFFPPFAPMIVPLRAALAAIEVWEAILAAVVAIAATYLMLVFGGRVYAGAVLRTGRVRLRDAWRASGQ
jgi:ABC-2 type transport system permease protein